MTNSQLARYAERIMALDSQIAELTADRKAEYAAAKGDGYTVSALRKAVKISSMEADKRAKHDQEQMDLELYLAEIEGRREAAE
ncbi:MAG: GapR family DNA-binding domain-containing protein [Caulobacterales bacterium]